MATSKIKKCSICKKEKSAKEFYVRKTAKDGLYPYCKLCNRERSKKRYHANKESCKENNKKWRDENPEKARELKRKWRNKNRERVRAYGRERYRSGNGRNSHLKNEYGITVEEYNALFLSQQGRCAICGKHQSEFKKRLFVDHDRETNTIRGLLCIKCNFALGSADESVEILKNMIKYLQGEL